MQTANTVAANAIYLPPLVVSVFALEPLPVSISSGQEQTSTRTTVSTFAQQLIQSVDVEECVYKAKGVSRPGYGVQLQSDQFMCVSCIHPRVTQSWCLSQQVGEGTLLPALDVPQRPGPSCRAIQLGRTVTRVLAILDNKCIKIGFCTDCIVSENSEVGRVRFDLLQNWISSVAVLRILSVCRSGKTHFVLVSFRVCTD